MPEAIIDGIGSGYPVKVSPNNEMYVLNTAIVDTYIQLLDYTAGGLPEYIGVALPGTNSGTSLWQIKKLGYNDSNAVTGILFASGNTLFDKSWTNKATYTYS